MDYAAYVAEQRTSDEHPAALNAGGRTDAVKRGLWSCARSYRRLQLQHLQHGSCDCGQNRM